MSSKISALTDGVALVATDRIPLARSPFASGDNRYATPNYFRDFLVGLANTWTQKQTITPVANTEALAVTGYSLTGANAQSLIDAAGTWNTSGTPTLIKANVVDTASNAVSLLADLQVGGVSRFAVTKAGRILLPDGVVAAPAYGFAGNDSGFYRNGTATIYAVGGNNIWGTGQSYLSMRSNGQIGWASGSTPTSNDTILTRESAAFIGSTGSLRIMNATAIPAGGTAGAGYKFSSTANFGVFFGSGAPSLVAAQGSLYLRSDGSGVANRIYVATDSAGAWTNLITSA